MAKTGNSNNTNNTEIKKARNSLNIKKILPENKAYWVLLLVMALVAIAFLAMMTVVNAFPKSITMGLLVVLLGLFALVWVLLRRSSRVTRVIGAMMAAIFLIVYGMGTYYLGTTYAMFNRISSEAEMEANAGNITSEAFNVYITGIDQWNKEKGLDLERSDVNMIVTVSPRTRKILLTSIPRDTYIELWHVPEMDKLTHTGIYGVEETIKSVEKWLGVDMNYYVKMNFSAVRDVIDAIGGIDVNSPASFKSSISNYEYEKGWNHMNGKKALFFARERKAFEGKDSLRVENQQLVVKAVINKLTSSTTLLTRYGDILDAAGGSLQTNMSSDDMQALVRMQLEDLGQWEIESQKIEGEYDLDYVASLTQEQRFQVYRPDPESVQKCLDNINAVMNPTDEEIEAVIEKRKEKGAMDLLRKLLGRGGDSEESAETAETAEGE